MAVDQDLVTLQEALQHVAIAAEHLPWAGERAWTPRTHLGATRGLPVIDLHDLSVRLALDTLESAIELDLSTGGLVLITGRGNHTGGRSKLRDAVMHALRERAESGQLVFHPLGPGRVEVVLDSERRSRARPGMGLLFWLFVALIALAIASSLYPMLQKP